MAFASKGFVIAEIQKRLAASGSSSGGGGSGGDPSDGHLEFGALTGTWDGYYGIQFLTTGEEFNLTGFNAPDDGDGGGAYLNGGWSVAGDGASAGVAGGYGGGGNGGDAFLSGGFGEATAGGHVYLVPGGCTSGAPGNVYIYDQGFNPILTFPGSGGSITAAASIVLTLPTGILRVGSGAVSANAVAVGADNTGMFSSGGSTLNWATSGTERMRLSTSVLRFRGDQKLAWSPSTDVSAAQDTAISRYAAGVLLVEDGSGAPSAILNKVSCVTSLATAGAPTLLAANQSNTYFNNLGAAAQAYFTMPTTWVAGYQAHWTVISTQGIRVQCSPNQTIVGATLVSTTSSGYIESFTYGGHLTLTGITSGTWYVTGVMGDWSLV